MPATLLELSAVSRDMLTGDAATARKRIDRAVRRIDVRVGI